MNDMPDYVRAVYTSVKNTWQDAENLDATHGYVTYIWIPEETFKIDVMKLHVYAEKFRAFSKGAKAGGGVTETSEGGGAHSHVVTGVTSGASSENTTVGGGTHSHGVTVVTSGASSEVTTVGGGGIHHHKMFDYYGDAVGDPRLRVFWCSDLVGGLVGVVFTTQQDVDLYTAVYNIDHTHGMAHTHEISGQTAVAVGNHTHGMAHNHTVSGQTATAVGTHTHDVTLEDHTHKLDFGIYEESIAGRTLSAILYDPDGNELKDFGVLLTGEDSDIVDLTDYFETLSYGMYKMVLSASGRLRARLIFYELCKMYAQF